MVTSNYTDEEVVRRVLEGDTALYELLMRRYNERLYRAARAITKNDGEAEDVMQQAYVDAFANLRQFNGRARFATWLTRIAINEALACVRRTRRYEPFDHDREDVAPLGQPLPEDPERLASAGELREVLEWAIDRLPDGAREVYVLRELQELTTAETADLLDVSEDVVKTRLSRARAALRRVLLGRTGGTPKDAFRFYRPRCDRMVADVLARIGAEPTMLLPESESR